MSQHGLHLDSPLSQWVENLMDRAAVLDELGLDYCCRGHRSLKEACLEKGLDPHQVMSRLQETPVSKEDESGPDWRAVPLADLVEHLETHHHAYLKKALPQIAVLMEKVRRAHAARHPELNALAERLADLRAELEPHLMKEEDLLFPALRRALASREKGAELGPALGPPIAVMTREHEQAGRLLEQIRSLTRNFQVPADGCTAYRALMESLRALEADTHRHIFLENTVLFPRALNAPLE